LALGLVDFAIAPRGFHLSADNRTPALALAALCGLGLQTFAEEFVFRGYVTQGLLLATRRTAPTAVVSGLLFGAMHIPNGAPQALSATLLGMLLAVIAIRTGGIALTYGIHLANNLFGALVLVSAGDAFHGAAGLVTQNTPQLMWWDTGLAAVAMLAMTVLLDKLPWRDRA
jgi:membrane protease YdiL (CAAX protease family)